MIPVARLAHRHNLQSRRSRSSGVVLVLALVLLVVMTVSSVVAMRAATSSDMVSQNLRAQNLALQAAELALRWCEGRVISGAAINTFPANPRLNESPVVTDEWRVASNWTDASRVNTLPASVLGTTVNYETPPQCIVRIISYNNFYAGTDMSATTVTPEKRGVQPDNIFLYRITARGYSPDFQRNAGGTSISGAEAWVQSTIRTVL